MPVSVFRWSVVFRWSDVFFYAGVKGQDAISVAGEDSAGDGGKYRVVVIVGIEVNANVKGVEVTIVQAL